MPLNLTALHNKQLCRVFHPYTIMCVTLESCYDNQIKSQQYCTYKLPDTTA